MTRALDVRPGEGALVAVAFTTLLGIMVGHTILETARDALLLQRLPPRALGIVYVVIALLTLPVGGGVTRVSRRFGPPRALGGALLVTSALAIVLFFLPKTATTAILTYTLSGLVGATILPEFWVVLSAYLTVAQGRRLVGTIAASGIVGAVLGSSLSGLALMFLDVAWLLPLAACAFTVVGVAVLFSLRHVDRTRTEPGPTPGPEGALPALASEPFLWRIALLVVLSTATVLTADYLFKFTVAKSIPAERLGPFFARYYAALNVVSFVVQIFVSRKLVERVGVASALAVTPLFLAFGGGFAALSAGSLVAVLVVKGMDGSLRYSLQRITSELLYLPISEGARTSAKPFLDGAVARATQAATALVFLALAETHLISRRGLSWALFLLATVWLVTAVVTRVPYLALLRRALASGQGGDATGPDPLDFASAELLVERLASTNPLEIVAAMHALERRGRPGLIPALVLFHSNENVLVHALDVFARTPRTDWFALAEPMLRHPVERVRRAAIRAFAVGGRTDLLERDAADESPSVRAYVALHLALKNGRELLADPRIAEHLAPADPDDLSGRLALLSAIADAPATRSLADLLVRLSQDQALFAATSPGSSLFANAALRQQDPRLVPLLVPLLTRGPARNAVRVALVSYGDVALEATAAALADPSLPRRLRTHLPRTLSRFGTKRAAGYLMTCIETERDGLVRYKAIRGLGRLVADRGFRMDRRRLRRLVEHNLVEHLRLFALNYAMGLRWEGQAADERRALATGLLLSGLLEDKASQALERAFRLLQISQPREQLQRVHVAVLSKDARLRANAGEFLEAFFFRRAQQRVRALLRLVTDDIEPRERVRRAAEYLAVTAPDTHSKALVVLMNDPDVTVASLSSVHGMSFGAGATSVVRDSVVQARPAVLREALRFMPKPAEDPQHGE